MLIENRIQISGFQTLQMRLHISISKRDSIRHKLRNGKIIKDKVYI
jgi:hypothetical protein